MDNTVTLVGNITRDPELRFTPSGQAAATLGLAVNRVWNDRQSGERKEAVSFFDVVCWREMAENAAESLSKGSRVIVTGRLEQRSWENQQGEKQYKIEVIADEIGPSLRWATATVTRNERRGPGEGGGAPGGGGYSQRDSGGYGSRDAGRPAPAPAGAGQQSAPPYGSYDEEPF
ncbi:MAG TPA: single-stranded DNA-binding protein [Acidimicrobiales bacterium]|nr:single-stranded DNA-binding protein [Acidimicrobiales bacterium]